MTATAPSPHGSFDPEYTSHAEVMPPKPEKALIYDIFEACQGSIPLELEADHLAIFDSAVSNLTELQLSPIDRQRAESAADYLRWKLFPSSDQERPAGVHIYDASSRGKARVQIEVDAKAGIGMRSDAQQLAEALLGDRGITDMLGQRRRLMSDAPETNMAMQNYLLATPVYRFLQSFDETAPQTINRPLTLAERQIREAQLEREVRERYRLSSDESLQRHTSAGQELGRKLYGLDEEMVRASKEGQADPLERIKNFAIDNYLSKVKVEPDENIYVHTREELTRAWTAKRPTIEDREIREWMLEDLMDTLEVDSGFSHYRMSEDSAYEAQDDMLRTALEIAFAGHVAYDSRQADIKSLLSASLVESVQVLRGGIAGSFDLIRGGDHDYETTAAWLRGNDWEDVEARPASSHSRGLPMLEFDPHPQVDIISKSEYQAGLEQTIGWIKRTGEAMGDRADRLMTVGPKEGILPGHVADSDFTVMLERRIAGRDSVPHISGYKLVAHNFVDEVYEFKRTPEDDAYTAQQQIPFSRHRVSLLADSYRNMGMPDLAQAITGHQDTLTVHSLARMIAYNSDYTFDERVIAQKDTRRLESFATQVKDGRLQVQCTGANLFAALSIDILAGGKATKVMEGRVLLTGKDTRISELGHAQVLAVIDGQHLIVDATPSAGAETPPRADWREVQQQLNAARAAHTAIDSATDRRVDENVIDTDESEANLTQEAARALATQALRRELAEANRPTVATVRQELDRQLSIIMNTRGNDETYNRMMKLPEADPLRRTLKLVLQTADPERAVSEMAIAETRDYLRVIAQADPDSIKRAGITQYNPGTIQSLQRIVEDLATARR